MKTLIQKITLTILNVLLINTLVIAGDNIPNLPTNIRDVVPKNAVHKNTYPKYTTDNDTLNIAILIGDASNGAFSTGIITETLKKTDYDITIGTSSGGLTTLFTYANARDQLIKFTNNLSTDNVLTERFKIYALLFGNSFANNDPLKMYIKDHITDNIIDSMKKKHNEGKRGYIISTNIDTAESVFWDIGAISSLNISYDERRDLLTKVAISSTSLPGIFPPEKFNVSYKGKTYSQTLVDGGVATNEIIQDWMLPQNFDNISKKNVYMFQTKEFIHSDPAVENKTVNIMIGALAATYTNTYYLYKSILGYWATKNNVQAYVNNIPKNTPLNFSGLDFSKHAITTQYNAGRKLVKNNQLQWIDINK